jgi:putative FmdB family regulatory protein
MPLYEYECESCGVTFEVIQKFADRSVDTCRTCGGKVHRLLSAPAIQFKGTGWYITDYARKGAGGAEKEKSDAAKAEGSASSGSATSAPATGSDSKTATTAPSTPAASTPSTPSSGEKN